MNSLHKGQWCGTFVFSLLCARTNGWVNNRDAGDLRCHCAHYNVTVMYWQNEVSRNGEISLHLNGGHCATRFHEISPVILNDILWSAISDSKSLITPGQTDTSKLMRALHEHECGYGKRCLLRHYHMKSITVCNSNRESGYNVIKWKYFLPLTGPLLYREFTGHLWIPLTKASDAELWCFLWYAPEQTVE